MVARAKLPRPRFLPVPWGVPLAILATLVVWSAGCASPTENASSDETADAGGVREPVETRASVDKAVATTGDVITYRVVVDYDSDYELYVPEPGADIAGFRIVDLGDEEPVARDGRIIEERWYRLRADLVGSYVLPPIAVGYSPTAGGEATGMAVDPAVEGGFSTVETSAIFVEVESVLPQGGEASDIRELKPLRRVERPVPWGWIGGVAGALIALGIGLWLYLRRRRRASMAPLEPAHVVAFRSLDELRSLDFADPVEIRRFYFAISEVVRAYVEDSFGLNATDLTTEEILAELAGLRELADGPRQVLRGFLVDTDRVKFADQPAGQPEVEATYEQALGFVELTMPRPEEEVESADTPTERADEEIAA